jgi:hypothetical protein
MFVSFIGFRDNIKKILHETQPEDVELLYISVDAANLLLYTR